MLHERQQVGGALICALEVPAMNGMGGSREGAEGKIGKWCVIQYAYERHHKFRAHQGILSIFVFEGPSETELCRQQGKHTKK